MTTRTPRLVLLGSLLVTFALVTGGCPPVDSPGTVCTADYRYGLTVIAEDPHTGKRLCDAEVKIVDGTYTETLMPFLADDPTSCSYHGAGERAGTYTVTIAKKYYQTSTFNVTVGKDECHVKGETRSVTVMPIVCLTDFRFGLVITVKDTSGARICDATVEAVDGTYKETLPVSLPTDPTNCVYQGAGERGGSYTLTVSKTGFETKTLAVPVAKDECHVIREQRTVELAASTM